MCCSLNRPKTWWRLRDPAGLYINKEICPSHNVISRSLSPNAALFRNCFGLFFLTLQILYFAGAKRRIRESSERRARPWDSQRCGTNDLAPGLRAEGQAPYTDGSEEQSHAGDRAAWALATRDWTSTTFQYKVNVDTNMLTKAGDKKGFVKLITFLLSGRKW